MGLTTASVGVCGVIFSQINDLLFGKENYSDDAPTTDDSTYHFLIFLAFTMAAGIFLGSFFLGPIQSSYQKIMHEEDQTGSVENSPLLAAVDSNKPEDPDQKELSISGLEFLKNPIGSALFITMFVVLGIGYIYLANIGQILGAVSRNATQHTRNLHITLFSLGNCGSRAFFGAVSDILRNKFGIHRLWIFVFAVVSLLMTLTYLVTFTITTASLVPCTLIVSNAYGIVFGVGPAATTEFGTEVSIHNQ